MLLFGWSGCDFGVDGGAELGAEIARGGIQSWYGMCSLIVIGNWWFVVQWGVVVCHGVLC